ncbi:PAAR domain-containing protein [Pseudomonas koreensis]|uniref:PAAR domain-containing protein n=2 Tax=Pseudomonas TaxID=286 RepID=UPI0014737FDB|nr:PAAR domain-containing protein [Pseudomonas koreensis]NNA55717.1 PAAR domain-containing protein [Pseudomonas koreensis]
MAGKPVARLGDPGSHGGNITTGSSPIFVNSMPVALVGDTYSCPVHGSNPITTGAPHVFGLGKDVAHVGSQTACGATITAGSPDTLVGESGGGSPISFFSQFLKETTFVEFQLLNEKDEQIANEAYELTLPDGTLMTGVLDGNGFVHVAGIPRGSCSIKFPKLEDTERL